MIRLEIDCELIFNNVFEKTKMTLFNKINKDYQLKIDLEKDVVIKIVGLG